MRTRIISFLYSIICSICICLTLIIPDFLLRVAGFYNHKVLSPFFLSILTLLIFFTITTRSKYWTIFILLGLAIIHLCEVWHIAYFGNEIMPEEIYDFLKNFKENLPEVISSSVGHISQIYLAFLILFSSYIAAFFLYYKTQHKLLKINYAWVFSLMILAIAPLRVTLHPCIHLSYPNPLFPSIINGLNTLSLVIFKSHVLNQPTTFAYKPYKVITKPTNTKNIILVMGESMRDDYMSLMGYQHNTTPLLDKRKTDKNFFYAGGISSGVSTSVSLPIFFNLMREPHHLEVINTKMANLFRLAKLNGYKTILISMQSSTLLYQVGIRYIDHLFCREHFDDQEFAAKRDELLLSKLDSITLGEKNFIVLHQRSMHSPYPLNYSHRKSLAIFDDKDLAKTQDRFEFVQKTYSNAMRFNDFILNSIFDYCEKKFKEESYVFFTSDHGELLGEQGLLGHYHLNIKCASVPFIVFGIKPNEKFMQTLNSYKKLTHYDFGLLIADRIGFKISNPNITEKHYYIHGINFTRNYDYITYKIEKDLVQEARPLKQN